MSFGYCFIMVSLKCKSLLKPVKKCLMQLPPTPGGDTAHQQVYNNNNNNLFICLFIVVDCD